MARHKWNGKPIGECSNDKGGLGVVCLKCGCVKEIILGRITYFINDNVTDKAPNCDERLSNKVITDSLNSHVKNP